MVELTVPRPSKNQERYGSRLMDMKLRLESNISILEINGRFDANETPKLTKWLEEAVTSERPNVVINLSGSHFIDSTALASLVKVMKRCRENKGDLHICNLQMAAKVIFELTRLDKAFKIFDSEEEALKAFG